MAQLPEAMRAAEQLARDAQAGQNDMFGAAMPAAASTLALPQVDEWPIAQRLAGERDTLGHYLSGHPTDAWRDLLAPVTTCAIGDVDRHYKPPAREGRQRFADLQAFTLAGSVVALRKQGENRAFVTVEDYSGRFEAVLYRESWVEFGPLLTRDAILVFDDATPEAVLAAVKPDVHVKGADYANKPIPERAIVEAYGGRVELVDLVPDRSTTSTIAKLRS